LPFAVSGFCLLLSPFVVRNIVVPLRYFLNYAAKGKQGSVKIFRDIDGYWILIDIVTLWFKDLFSLLLFRLLFPTFVFFCSLLWFGTIWFRRGLF
jgi:hypothetical protein